MKDPLTLKKIEELEKPRLKEINNIFTNNFKDLYRKTRDKLQYLTNN